MVNNLSPIKPKPVHEILARLSAVIPSEITNQLPDLDIGDIKAALDTAAITMRERAGLPNKESEELVETSIQAAADLDPNKILVVDDVNENLFLIEYLFKNTEFSLSLVADAKEALVKARTERPILIISDVMMPQMSGFELLTALKEDERTKNIGIILVTAHHRSSKEVARGLQMGADDYIYRPFVRDEFMLRVEAVLRLKRAEAETQRQGRILARRNRGLAWLNELALAVNSSLDVREIFSSSMRKLSQLLNAKAVSLLLLNKDKQELVVSIASRSGGHLSVPLDLGSVADASATLAEARVLAIVQDILNSHQGYFALQNIPELRVIQHIPMFSKDQVIGAIVIIDERQGSIDEADRVLLHSAAGIISMAVENTRLLENAQELVDDLIALNDIGQALTSTLDLKQILKQTTLLVQQALQADATSVWLIDDAEEALELIAASGAGAREITGYKMPLQYGIAGHVAQTGEIYVAADLSKDERHYRHIAQISNYQPRSMLTVPVQVKGVIIGVMQALHQEAGWFNGDDLRLAYPIASSVGIAIENARLFSKVQTFSHHLERMVTERTHELAEEKEKTEAILQSMADGLLVLDAENFILTANDVAEKMLDFRLSELSGQPIGPERLEHPLWRCITDIAGSAGAMTTAMVDVPPVGGDEEVPLSIQAQSAKVRNESGQIIGTVITLRDLTALKEVERMKANFVSGVTHELKTPLAVIQLYAANLSNYYDRLPVKERNDLLKAIQTQTQHLGQLIEDILALSRLDTGIVEATRQSINLVELVDQVITSLRPLAEATQVRLLWTAPADQVSTWANRGQLEQVIRNLIDNAIKYTPAGGSVTVQTVPTAADGGGVEFQVNDTGIGIPLEHQARVFERFYRVDPAHTIPGTGLGLAIVKEVIEAYGGTVQLDSTPGAGSTFTITLPSADLAGG